MNKKDAMNKLIKSLRGDSFEPLTDEQVSLCEQCGLEYKDVYGVAREGAIAWHSVRVDAHGVPRKNGKQADEQAYRLGFTHNNGRYEESDWFRMLCVACGVWSR